MNIEQVMEAYVICKLNEYVQLNFTLNHTIG